MAADLGALVYSFPPEQAVSDHQYDEQIKSFIQSLSKISPKKWTDGQGTDTDLLNILNPSIQTLPYLQLLLAYISPYEQAKNVNTTPPPQLLPSGAIWNKIEQFLSTFDPIQIRYVGKDWVRLVRFVFRVANGMQMVHFAIPPIRNSLLRLDPRAGVLTNHHLTVLRVCMSLGLYAEALPLLDQIIHAVPAKDISPIDSPYLCAKQTSGSSFITVKSGFTSEITTDNVQEYFLLGGMAYIALKRWEDAQIFLEHVMVVPTQGVATGMMVEAYRKWLLVGCLVHGYVPKLPKAVNATAAKDMKTTSQAYHMLADIFHVSNQARLKAEIDVGQQIWFDDGNTGLVDELVDQLLRFYVAKLEKTYSAVPVSTVAQWLNQPTAKAEAYIQQLIAAGQLNASIHSASPAQGADAASSGSILRFFSDPSTGPRAKPEEDQLSELQAQTAKTNLLAEYVKDADRKLAVTKEWVINLIRRENEKAAQLAGGTNGATGAMHGMSAGDAMDTTWDNAPGGFGADDGEEDLMEELH